MPEYLLSLSTTRLSFLVLNGYGDVDLDAYHAWFDKKTFGKEEVLNVWKNYYHGSCELFDAKFDPAEPFPINKHYGDLYVQMSKGFDQNVLSLVAAYPEVTFHLFMPPMSDLAYMPPIAIMRVLLPQRNMIVGQTATFPNVRVYDFQSIANLADLNRYADTIHFDLDTTRYIIDAIHGGRHRLTAENLIEANQRIIDRANAFDLCRTSR
jgi:hypothetical protein